MKPQVAMSQLLSLHWAASWAGDRDIVTEPPSRAVKEQASGELWDICVAM